MSVRVHTGTCGFVCVCGEGASQSVVQQITENHKKGYGGEKEEGVVVVGQNMERHVSLSLG